MRRTPRLAVLPPDGCGVVRIGRVYDGRSDDDGRRVLIDRLWPRGLAKEKADVDDWCREVAPSTELRKWFGHDPERFTEFGRRYRAELKGGPQAAALADLRDQVERAAEVTLLTAARDPEVSHAAVLAALLGRRRS